jgi:hypothetical protein
MYLTREGARAEHDATEAGLVRDKVASTRRRDLTLGTVS